MNYPIHEEATECKKVKTVAAYVNYVHNNLYTQNDDAGKYETTEMFEFTKNNTNDQCKRMSHYYLTIEDYVNTANNEMLQHASITDSTPLIQSESSHTPADSYYNISSYTDTEQQVSDGGSNEPIFMDPGVKEDGIYNWLKSRRISLFTSYEIK